MGRILGRSKSGKKAKIRGRQERINLQTEKYKKREKEKSKGKQAKVANQKTKQDLPVENGQTKNKESPASDEAGEKTAKSD